MNYEITQDNTKLSVKLEGPLDVRTSPDLERALFPALEGITDVEIDLEGVNYISSAGLRVLLSAQKVMTRQGEMKIVHVNETILEIFEVTGFSEILTIE